MLDFTRTLEEDRPLIHPTCVVKNCTFGRYVELGDHCIVEETHVGDYTYLFGSNDVIYSHIGKFGELYYQVQHFRKIKRVHTAPCGRME